MSALEIRLLTCDGLDDGEVCDAEYGGDADMPSFRVLRAEAHTLANWTSANGRDYCPDHAAQARAVVGDVGSAVAALRALLAPSPNGGAA